MSKLCDLDYPTKLIKRTFSPSFRVVVDPCPSRPPPAPETLMPSVIRPADDFKKNEPQNLLMDTKFVWIFMSEPAVPFDKQPGDGPEYLLAVPPVKFDLLGSPAGQGTPVSSGTEDLVGPMDEVFQGFNFTSIVVHLWWAGYPTLNFPFILETMDDGLPMTRLGLGRQLTRQICDWHKCIVDHYQERNYSKKYKFVEDGSSGVRVEQLRLLALSHVGGYHFAAVLDIMAYRPGDRI